MHTEIQYYVNLLSPYVHTYGYLVAFFGMMLENAGIPVPAESTLVAMAFFAGQKVLSIWLVIPIAIVGDVVGDNIGFWIGREGGRPLVEKYGKYVRIDQKKLSEMEALFKEKGGRTVYTAHFFATTRILAALTAGMSHMPYKRFLTFNILGAISFVTVISLVSYHFSKNLDTVLRFLHYFRWAGFVVLALIIIYYFHKHFGKRIKE